MADLVPNPDGCPRFEPNQFKKEKCKNCGRQWQEHKGVITQEVIDGYMGAKNKMVADKAAKEAEAKAKLRAKAVAKKKAAQAPEDDWLNDGTGGGGAGDASESDDDMGFRMFTAGDFNKAPVESRGRTGSEVGKPLKVTNLIDFGECDVQDDEPVRPPNPPAPAPMPVGASGPASSQASGSQSLPGPRSSFGGSGSPMAPPVFQPMSMGNEELTMEIEHLRQQLSQANEMKNIEIEIIRDEVDEKKKIIEELKKKSYATEATRLDLTQQLADGEAARAALVLQHEQEVQGLREAATSSVPQPPAEARMEAAPSVAADAQAAMALADEELQRLRAEVTALKAAATAAAAAPAEVPAVPAADTAELASLRAEVEDLRRWKAGVKDQQATMKDVPQERIAAPTWPLDTAQVISELSGLCGQTRQALNEDTPVNETTPAAEVEGDPETALRRLREHCIAAHAAARESGDERRRLVSKLSEAEAATAAAVNAAAAAAQATAAATATATPVPDSVPVPARAAEDSSPEAQAAAQAVGRQAALALREVRLNAERQLAWITKRIKLSGHPGAVGGPVGSQNVDPLASGGS